MNTSIITIAVISRDPFTRKGLVSTLNEYKNFKVTNESYSGNDLIMELSMHNEPPHVVVLDAITCFIECCNTASSLIAQYPALKVVVLSQCRNDFYACKLINSGVMAYLIVNTNTCCELITAVQTVANGKCYYGQIGKDQFEKARNTKTSDLTEKEIQFLQFFCQGFSMKVIAAKMHISKRTAEHYNKQLCEKLNVANKMQLVLFAAKVGIVPA